MKKLLTLLFLLLSLTAHAAPVTPADLQAMKTAVNANVGENLSALRQYTLTVTGTNWTTVRAVGVPYRTLDGVWRLRFNITGTTSSSSRTSYLVTISGVAFKSGAGNYQAISAFSPSGSGFALGQMFTGLGNGELTIVHASGTTGAYSFSGDVELDAKPTFVP